MWYLYLLQQRVLLTEYNGKINIMLFNTCTSKKGKVTYIVIYVFLKIVQLPCYIMCISKWLQKTHIFWNVMLSWSA